MGNESVRRIVPFQSFIIFDIFSLPSKSLERSIKLFCYAPDSISRDLITPTTVGWNAPLDNKLNYEAF